MNINNVTYTLRYGSIVVEFISVNALKKLMKRFKLVSKLQSIPQRLNYVYILLHTVFIDPQ